MANTFNTMAAAINQELADAIVASIMENFGTMKGHCKEFGVLYTVAAKQFDPESAAFPVASTDPAEAGTELFDHIAIQVPGAPQIYDRTGARNTDLRVLEGAKSQSKVTDMIFGDNSLQARLDKVLAGLRVKYPQLAHITAEVALKQFEAILTAGASVNAENAVYITASSAAVGPQIHQAA